MDTKNLSVNQLNYMYQHGDRQAKDLVTARLGAMQMAQQLSQRNVPDPNTNPEAVKNATPNDNIRGE